MKKTLLTSAITAISKALTRRLLKLSPLLFMFCSLTGYAQCGYINTVAGNGTASYSGDGGVATSAEIWDPRGVAVDASGNIYIADYDNNRVRKVSAATGDISTVAGNGTAGYSGDGGLATSAELSSPIAVAVDDSGNIYITDANNDRIRKVSASTGIISTVAGNGTVGYAGDGGAATSAKLNTPWGVAVDASGNIYIGDDGNNRIREVSASTGLISTVAGDGTAGFSGDGGAATSAEIAVPAGIAVDASGNIFIADQNNERIRKVTASTGLISTVAGTGTAGYSGDGGPATSAELLGSVGVAVDASGNIYIGDSGNNRIRKVSISTGLISTVAGTGIAGYSGDGGAATSAELHSPGGVAVDAAGNIYIADGYNSRIREITGTPNPIITGTTTGCGSVTLTATGGTSYAWSGGSSPNTATNTFTSSGSYTVTATNNGCTATASAVVTVNTFSSGGIINTVAGDSVQGYSGDGGAATSAELYSPEGVALDASGNIYIADGGNNRIRKVSTSTGFMSTVAGNGTQGYSGDGGTATSAELYFPYDVALDTSGNIYIADGYNQRIRKVTVATGLISTVAGNGFTGYSGDGSAATTAELNYPHGVALDASGNIFIVDVFNNRIRKVTVSTGIISTVAGNGTAGYSGDGGPATSAELYYPTGVSLDAAGNIYIADEWNNRIRKVSLSTGFISTVAGNGTAGYSGDGGTATSAELSFTSEVTVDDSDNIYIADQSNQRIRKVSASTGDISTVAGSGTYGYSGDGGAATLAELHDPFGVAVDASGNIYIADQDNNRIRKVIPGTPNPVITGTTTGCGQVTLTATGGTSYAWSGGSSPNTATNTFSSSGTYTVTATANGGCSATVSQVVTVNPTVTAGITGTTTGCGSVTLIATGGTGYAWSGGGSPSTATNTFTSSGTYTVTVTANGGCSATVSQVVTVNPTVTAGITGMATGCGLVSLTATGGNSYTWSGGSSPNTAINTFTSSNTYIVTATGTGGCSATASQAVTVNPNITAGITGTATGCGSVSLTATGGGSYAWNGGNSTNTAANTFTSSNTYTVTVTDNGCTATASQAVTVNTIPTATITPTGSTTFCQGDSVILTASAGSSYLWSTSATTQSIDVKNPGSYTVQVGNANCSATSAATVVTVNALPNAAINGPTTICSGLQATLTASGGTGYSWNNGLGTNAQVNVQPTNTTTYIVTVTNANNCSATAQQTVSVTNTPTATINGPQQVCSGNGITLTANGGNTYSWANGLGSNATINVSPTSNTTYTVTATIGANCSATASQTVAVYQPAASQFGQTICSGDSFHFNNQNLTQSGPYNDTLQTIHGCDSIVTLNLTVNSILQTAFSDSICHGDSVMFNGHSYTGAGTYYDTLQAVTGCDSIVTLSLSIKSTSGDTVRATADHPVFCSGDSTQVCATTGFAAYNWNNNASTACFYTGSANTYSVTVTDVHGCTAASNSIVITTYTPSSVTITSSGDTVSSTGAAAYQWYFNSQPITGDTANVIIAQHTGSYTVETTDSNGCHYTSSAVVVNTGVNDITTGYGVKLYPNPNTGNFTLEFTDDIVRQVEIIDAVGRMIMPATKVERQKNFNLNEMASGIYILRVNQNDEQKSFMFSIVR